MHTGFLPPKARLILSAQDLEDIFDASPWRGPALIEIQGTGPFEVMTKLISPSGLISNTNCVREEQVHNIEGFDSNAVTYVRFINDGREPIRDIRGSLYDENGDLVGFGNPVIVEELLPKAHIWRTRDQLAEIAGDTWLGSVSLRIQNPSRDLKLINLNLINNETFFNFSCYESGQ